MTKPESMEQMFRRISKYHRAWDKAIRENTYRDRDKGIYD